MPIEVAPPKYVVIVNALQQRIESGTYARGVMIPSESALMREFGASRPIVVRALDMLRQDGWIESHQGKGRFVRGVPAKASRQTRQQAYALLAGPESTAVQVLSAGLLPVPTRAAGALGLPEGTPVVARRRLVTAKHLGPVELGTAYVPVDLADGTDVGDTGRLREGLLPYLAARKRVVFDHVVERISARLPSAEEARLLEVGRRDSILVVLLTVCDQDGKPLLVLDVALPASRHELEDVFTVG